MGTSRSVSLETTSLAEERETGLTGGDGRGGDGASKRTWGSQHVPVRQARISGPNNRVREKEGLPAPEQGHGSRSAEPTYTLGWSDHFS